MRSYLIGIYLCIYSVTPYMINAQEVIFDSGFGIDTLAQGTYIENDDNFQSSTILDVSFRAITDYATGYIISDVEWVKNDEPSLTIKQAWAKILLGDGHGVYIGKKVSRWKEGGYRNPTDLLNPTIPLLYRGSAEGRFLTELSGNFSLGVEHSLDYSIILPMDQYDDNGQIYPVYFSLGALIYPLEIKVKSEFYDSFEPNVGLVLKTSVGDLQIISDTLIRQETKFESFKDRSGISFLESLSILGNIALPKRFSESISFLLEYNWLSDGIKDGESQEYIQWLLQNNESTVLSFSRDYRQYFIAQARLNRLFLKDLNYSAFFILNLEEFNNYIVNGIEFSPVENFNINLQYVLNNGEDNSEKALMGFDSLFRVSLKKVF